MLSKDTWVVDLFTMTCWNLNKDITVGFEYNGVAFIGKIKDMPFILKRDLGIISNGQKIIQNFIAEAEEAFLKVYTLSYI